MLVNSGAAPFVGISSVAIEAEKAPTPAVSPKEGGDNGDEPAGEGEPVTGSGTITVTTRIFVKQFLSFHGIYFQHVEVISCSLKLISHFCSLFSQVEAFGADFEF